MKIIFRYVVVVAIFLTLAVVVPQSLKVILGTARQTPVVAYSPLLHELGILDYRQKGSPVKLRSGRELSTAEFDSLFPLLNYRQLLVDGHMPDSINGHESSMRAITSRQFYATVYATTKSEHPSGLHLMYESMPRRVNNNTPTDVFSLDNRFVFIDAETRQENEAKGQQFTEALQRAGFQFPCLDCWGEDNPRKRYDEGFMCVDADSSLFHIKMVSGRPFCRKIPLPDGAHPVCVPQCLPTDKSFYCIVFSSDRRVFLVSAADEGGYAVQQFNVPPFDVRKNTVRINADLLSWVILSSGPDGCYATAFDRESLQLLDSLSIPPFEPTTSEKFAAALMPLSVDGFVQSDGSTTPILVAGPGMAWLLSLAIGLIFWASKGRKHGTLGLAESLWIVATGVCGLLALLCVPRN